VPAQRLDQAALHLGAVPGRVLGLDQQPDRPAAVPHRFQQPVEGEQPGEVGQFLVGREAGMPRAEVQHVELGQRLAADQAAAVAGAVEPAVVHADQVAVAGEPDVALEAVRPVLEGAQVGTQGVLRQRVGSAAVGEDQWSVLVHRT
jgi:hypothetical protein